MRVSIRSRALVTVAAAASMVVVPMALPGSAAVAQPGKCTKLTTKTVKTTLTATLTGCTPLAATGGKGSGTFKSTSGTSGTIAITIKWAASKGTTKGTIKFANQKTRGKCAAGATRIKITGSVTGGTGVAFKTIKKGQPITGSVCSGAKGITLEPGTTLKF
jgi:redox-regulated HSP33 family molecular chaperone